MNFKNIVKRGFSSVLAVAMSFSYVQMGFMNVNAVNATTLSSFKNIDMYKYIRITNEQELLDFSKRSARQVSGRDLEYTGPEYGWGWANNGEVGEKAKIKGAAQFYNPTNDRTNRYDSRDFGIMLMFHSDQTNSYRYMGGNRNFDTNATVKAVDTFDLNSQTDDMRNFDPNAETQYLATVGRLPVLYYTNGLEKASYQLWWFLKATEKKGMGFTFPNAQDSYWDRYWLNVRSNLGDPTNDNYWVHDAGSQRRKFRTNHLKATWFFFFFNKAGKCMIIADKDDAIIHESNVENSNCGDVGADYLDSNGNGGNYSSNALGYITLFDMWIAYKDRTYGSTLDTGTYQIPAGNTVSTTRPFTYINKNTTIYVYGDLVIDNDFYLAGNLIVYGNLIIKDGGTLHTNYRNDLGSIYLFKDSAQDTLTANLIIENGATLELVRNREGSGAICPVTLSGGSILNDGVITLNFDNYSNSVNKTPINGNFIKIYDYTSPSTVRFTDNGMLYLLPGYKDAYTSYLTVLIKNSNDKETSTTIDACTSKFINIKANTR